MLQKRIDDQPTISRENIREAEGIFLQHLRRVGLKQTEQRNAILLGVPHIRVFCECVGAAQLANYLAVYGTGWRFCSIRKIV